MTQDRRVKRTKRAFERAFLELMHEKNYQDITIHAICRKADYTRGAFYNHFNSKEDMIHKTIEHRVEALWIVLKNPYLTNRQLEIDMYHPAALLLFDHIYSNRDFYQLIKHPDFKLILQEKMVNMFIHHFLFDLSFEYADSTQTIEKEIKAYHLAYATLGVISYWIDQKFRFSSQYMAEELMRITTTPMFRANYKVREFEG
ncbi:TetR/AcrR family transcriptional regulator [Planococcus sp. X10-3]|uniref:TetR/AcrR family transcriptional regulator n=1 Tax=Planococcus sp. X10-3 TaxID=3061240 RepID=UPI003BB1DF9F